VVEGDTIMLVYEEKMIESNMKKAKITEDKLMEAVPEHGVSSIEEVILPYNLLFKKTTNEDFSQ
ncbi:MAG: YetF domain-containing protein, partial [Bacteroidales bacterium]